MSSIDSSMTVGVFRDEAQAQQALSSLKGAGFDQIQLLHPDRAAQGGGLFSGIKRLFSSNNDGIAGNLTDTGVSEADARYYQQEYEAGHIILTVRANGRKQEALDILRRYGAYDAFTRGKQATAPTAPIVSPSETSPTSDTVSPVAQSTDEETRPTSNTASTVAQDTHEETENTLLTPPDEDLTGVYDRQHLNLKEERLDVSKQQVQTGEVGLHKDVVTEQRTLDVPVTHEEVVVERHALSGTASDASDKTPIGQDEEIRIPVAEEHVQVTKTPVIIGEVSAEKRSVRETQQVAGTTKREELRVEQEGDAPIHGTPSDRFHYGKQQRNATDKPRAKSRKKRER